MCDEDNKLKQTKVLIKSVLIPHKNGLLLKVIIFFKFQINQLSLIIWLWLNMIELCQSAK